jgi:hypothetical protein
MRQSLYCTICGARLSARLELLSTEEQAPVFEDRKPLTIPGVGFKSYGPMVAGCEHLGFLPQYWLNPDDLTPAVRQTDKSDRLSGCCGLAGCDGPNQLCQCGAEVGTLQSDCWTSLVFIAEPASTTWIDEADDTG